jgi:hypothetical protein
MSFTITVWVNGLREIEIVQSAKAKIQRFSLLSAGNARHIIWNIKLTKTTMVLQKLNLSAALVWK